MFLARGRAQEAVLLLEDAASAAEKEPDGAAKAVRLVNQLLAMNQPEAAERLALRFARTWPKEAHAVAGFLAGRGRAGEAFDAARAAFEAGATWEPMKLAFDLVATGRLDPAQSERARALAEAILAGQPKSPALALLAASLASRQGRYDDALETCRAALQANPSDVGCQRALNDLAWIFCEDLARPADALVEVDRVLKLASSPSALDTRGVALTRLGKFDEAIRDLERCVREEPAGNRFLHLARAYQMAGKPQQSQGALDRAKKVGINQASLSPKERAEFAAAIGR